MKNLRNLFQLSIKLVFFFTVCLASFTYFPSETDSTALAASYSSADYHAVPPFISRGVKPNVLIIIDNSNSMDEDIDGNAVGSAAPNSRSEIARQAIITLIDANSDRMRFGLMAYKQNSISRRHIHNATYYCSHDPDTYDAEGIPTPKDPSTNTLMFPNPSAPGRFIYYDQALPFYAFSDYGNSFCYCQDYSEDGDISNDKYAWYRTKTGITDPPSGEDPAGYGYTNNWGNDYFTLTDDDIAAGFDQIGEQMSWVHIGLTWFSNSSPGDGELHEPIEDSTTTDHITDLHNKLGTSQFASYVDTPLRNAGLTPIEGTLKSCRDYYKGTYPGHPSPVTNWCQKNFVILVTDGLPSVNTSGHADDADALLPGVESAVVSLRTTSVPLPSGTTVFDIQTFVLGFALPPGLGSKLDDIAVAGGTDEDGHAFIAGSSDELATALQKIFLEILNRASSGSAASVISNSRSGEGAIYQSIFFPELYDASSHTVTWTGDVHALLVDKFGRMHEDSNNNQKLDEETDKFIVYFDDEDDNTTKAKTFLIDADGNVTDVVDKGLTEIDYLWSGMDWLANPALNVTDQRTYSSTDNKRYIITDYIDTSADVSTSNVDSTQAMDFLPAFADDATHNNYFFLNPEDTGMTETEMITEAQNIIKFTRGKEGLSNSKSLDKYRNRTLVGSDGNDKVLRLGDIIHSTPTVVSRTSENYDLLYNDKAYLNFKKKYINRRMMVYSGANDGMLHAFNGGFYNPATKAFLTQPQNWNSGSSTWENDGSFANYPLGMELWAYVPNAVLPHLRWLTEPADYTSHIYYVDLKPRIFDANIFFQSNGTTPLDTDHPDGWGTVMICGMRLGGGKIGVDTDSDGTDNMTFGSTYSAFDITNPESAPKLLWSFTDSNLGFTTSYPTPIRVGSKWFIIIGSGPVDYEATRKDDGIHFTEYGGSNRAASVYVLNADDGSLAHTFTMDSHSFMADPIAADFDLKTTEEPANALKREWTGEAIYIASDGCGA